MFIRKPYFSPISGKWTVMISESRSPSSEVIEVMSFTNREAAWQAYRHAMSERI